MHFLFVVSSMYLACSMAAPFQIGKTSAKQGRKGENHDRGNQPTFRALRGRSCLAVIYQQN